ncbi:MAG: helix-turn-helix transcriptional regulator [Clostridia bacterium]|nr:helix-turn-helix transcriptional regulator [Clostridia bacterium]
MYYLPRLKEIRLLKNMKQKDVCELLNMKQSQYSRYESGEDEMKIGTLIEICQALNISADYILGLSDEPLLLNDDR